MVSSILISLGSFAALVILIRRSQPSLGLPVAYLFGLLLIHVPGALVHSFPWSELRDSDLTATGIRFTAIGVFCFVAGVWIARKCTVGTAFPRPAPRPQFWLFCLVAGWSVVYGLSPLVRIPSLGAAIQRGAGIWMIGVMLGLRSSLRQGSQKAFLWVAAMLVYPVLMLLLGGYLSYGSAAFMICLAPLVASTRNPWRIALGLVLTSILGLNVFLSYFQNRTEIRNAVWGGADFNVRVDAASKIFWDLRWFDPRDPDHLWLLDLRLNQNYLVGLAAARIEANQVDYLQGRSLWEGVLALVPRAFWPEKRVYAGSPEIVSEMTGLTFAEGTSVGVGNVMEFQVNFGLPGVVIGFLILGSAIGRLDLLAALAERTGDFPKLFQYFLPAVALIQPNGSIVELCSGSAAAWVAALGWSSLWRQWSTRRLSGRSLAISGSNVYIGRASLPGDSI